METKSTDFKTLLQVIVRVAFETALSKYDEDNPYYAELSANLRGEFITNLRRLLQSMLRPQLSDASTNKLSYLLVPQQWTVRHGYNSTMLGPVGIVHSDSNRSVVLIDKNNKSETIQTSIFEYNRNSALVLSGDAILMFNACVKILRSIKEEVVVEDYEILAIRDILKRMDTLVKGDI